MKYCLEKKELKRMLVVVKTKESKNNSNKLKLEKVDGLRQVFGMQVKVKRISWMLLVDF